MTSVAVIDDHALLAMVLTSDLQRHGVDAYVIDVDRSIIEQLEEAVPELVLLDLELGEGRPCGLDLIEPISDLGARVIVLSGVTEDGTLAACLERGAAGILAKDIDFAELSRSIDAAVDGGDLAPSAVERVRLSQVLAEHRRSSRRRLEPFDRLTCRESDVLKALMEGRSAADISESAVVSLSTARSHIKSILRKLDVGSQLQAVALAHEAAWNPSQASDH